MVWQLFALKNSVKKSEQAIREVLDDKEYEKLKHILEVTENQLKEVSSLLIKVDKQGVNQKSIRERCVNVCSELNKCYISLPSGDSYSNMLWEAYELDLEKLLDYPVWYADYEELPQTPYRFSMWQYSSTGSVPGIEGNVDLNIQLLKK